MYKRKGNFIRRVWIAVGVTVLIVVLTLSTIVMLHIPNFGQAPNAKQRKAFEQLPNYKDGAFQNQSFTPELTEGYSFWSVLFEFLFKNTPRLKPQKALPHEKVDLKSLSTTQDYLVWFGHSSYLIQLSGLRILVDPVLSGNASPIPGTTKAFAGTDPYTVDDLPEIDVLLITHDHYDHLDYATIIALKSKVRMVVCGLGVGSHLRYWDYDSTQIIEKNWNESVQVNEQLHIHVLPARHFSGRTFARNTTLWCSYILETPLFRIYAGGDSGYDTHYKAIGKQFSPIDIAILDNGQYDNAWRYIHNHPDEVLQAAHDLQAKRLFPVHSSKFVLGNHAWDEPLKRISALNTSTKHIPLITPIIGSVVRLADTNQQFTQWWNVAE